MKKVSERLHKLIVNGTGVVGFNSEGEKGNAPSSIRKLFLDDLEIKRDGQLLVVGWAEGRDHLLVRRDSEHLEESLKRIAFEGYDPNAIHLENYDKDYWEINAMPEPAAYGAGLMLGVVGLVRYRKRRKIVTSA